MWHTFVMQMFCNHFPWVLSRWSYAYLHPCLGADEIIEE
jgi:hypothetical protein